MGGMGRETTSSHIEAKQCVDRCPYYGLAKSPINKVAYIILLAINSSCVFMAHIKTEARLWFEKKQDTPGPPRGTTRQTWWRSGKVTVPEDKASL